MPSDTSSALVVQAGEFTPEDLAEVFAWCPLREVAFEVRFAPRLRVSAEIWRLQDQLTKAYPDVGKESMIQPNGTVLDVAVFQNAFESRVIKVSHQNFLVAFTRYIRFEDFKAEVLSRTEQFSSTFGVGEFTRLGLRYVNQITLESTDPYSLLEYLKPIIAFDPFPLNQVEQFATELHCRYKNHGATVRTALLPGALRTYILDIDCHRSSPIQVSDYPSQLDELHDSIQRIFLGHVTEAYKERMRVKP